MLFDKICRRNAITHRLTAPRSPTTTGKIERFHQTLRRELLDDARPFASLLAAQAALDDWVREYNASARTRRWTPARPVAPAERFQPAPDEQRELLELWLPASLDAVPAPQATASVERAVDAGADPVAAQGGPVEFDRVVPASGNLMVCQRQFWLGPARAGQTVRFWASVDVIHLTIAGARVKSLRSHFSTSDLDQLRRQGATPAGPPPLPLGEDGAAVEVDRAVNNTRPRRPRRQADPRRRDPRRQAGDRSRGSADADVPRSRDARAAARAPESAHPRAGAAPAGRAPGRTASAAQDRARHRPAARERQRPDHRLPPNRRRSAACTPGAWSRARLRAHARGRARRRRDTHDPPHHHPAGRRRQGQPPTTTARRDNVNRTLSSHRSRRVMTPRSRKQQQKEQQDPYGT